MERIQESGEGVQGEQGVHVERIQESGEGVQGGSNDELLAHCENVQFLLPIVFTTRDVRFNV